MSEPSRKVPELRFKGFTDDWELRKLSEVVDRVKSYPLSRSVETVEYTGFKYIHYGDIHTGKANLVDMNSDLPNINPGDYESLQKGDVTLADASEDYQGIASPAVVIDEMPYKLISGLHTIALRPKMATHHIFIIFFNSPTFKQFGYRVGTGMKVFGISISNLLKFNTYYPSIEEQIKIRSFLKKLNDTIALHQRKLDALKRLKEAYLQSMFPKNEESVPLLRFANFEEDWEQRKWSDTVDISNNMVDPKNGNYDNLPHIGPGNIESFTGRLLNNVKTVKEDNLISGKFHFNKGDIIYGKINPQLGKYIYSPYEGLASADAYVLTTKNGLDRNFLFILLQTNHFYRYSVSVSMRSGMPKINRNELNMYSFTVPLEVEQEEIGLLFLKLDKIIALHQQKLEQLQNLKKAYLQKMFI